MSDYKSLSTANLPDPAIDPAAGKEPADYFNTSNTWTGDGSNHSETSVGFQPDFVWMKSRSNGISHALFDAVRGVGKMLNSDITVAEITNSQFGYLSSFDTNGHTWTVGSTDGTYGTNSSTTYISWNWKANGSGVSNTDGSITSTVSANTESGFSIVSYTGTGTAGDTVGHGLGVSPSMFIVKNRDSGTTPWLVWHKDLATPATQWLKLDTTDSVFTNGDAFGAAPTSSVITVGSFSSTNGSGNELICYAFHSVEGFSKFGSYDDDVTGSDYENTSPFVYTGFRPAFVMIKGTSSGREWVMYDNKRTPDNGVYLRANTSAAEQTDATNHDISFNANGFKIRGGSGDINTTNESYIYMAFADQPLKYANGGTE